MKHPGSRPAHMPWVTPYLTVTSAEAALEFYGKAFGFEKREALTGPEGKVMHAELTWRDGMIMLGPECPQSGSKAPSASQVRSPVTLYVYCDDVDSLCDRARKAGATVDQPPQDMFWGDRMCRLIDPDGHIWCFATWKGETCK
jgi:PhnB protein